ncbi:hypothetical protein [Rhodospirillum centenum]|uniref:Uncharacterized protein n=1 Tax=Rhodospirillum centenum (strain ATCC 51521 / SW) TaxID=414684 RepID=B6IS30_RHOCS|nr:hypothetical protein [Rhodospirillum centenum]ACI98266.1 hypothetical protein RC1_0835 [Rhodospirillum centenum SW]
MNPILIARSPFPGVSDSGYVLSGRSCAGVFPASGPLRPALTGRPTSFSRNKVFGYLRDFVAVTSLFGMLYGWFVLGAALSA